VAVARSGPISLGVATGRTSDLETALDLTITLQERGELLPRVRAAATVIALNANTKDQWEAVESAIDDVPVALDVDRASAGAQFEEWINYVLTSALEEISDRDELYELEVIAERFGLWTDNALWIDAYDAISNRPEEPSTTPGSRRPSLIETQVSDDDLRAIFERLRFARDRPPLYP
jgi:hypothetical protein